MDLVKIVMHEAFAGMQRKISRQRDEINRLRRDRNQQEDFKHKYLNECRELKGDIARLKEQHRGYIKSILSLQEFLKDGKKDGKKAEECK